MPASEQADWMDVRDREGVEIDRSQSLQAAALDEETRDLIAGAAANFDVPKAVAETLAVNPRFMRRFYQGVGRTLYKSMTDPETRPREMTGAAIKERMRIIADMLDRLHGEGCASLVMTVDKLWDAVREHMVRRDHPDDAAERAVVGAEGANAGKGAAGDGGVTRMWSGGSETRVGSIAMGSDAPDVRDGREE